jgi:hypothetical protein
MKNNAVTNERKFDFLVLVVYSFRLDFFQIKRYKTISNMWNVYIDAGAPQETAQSVNSTGRKTLESQAQQPNLRSYASDQ